jgi:hypothetical protein
MTFWKLTGAVTLGLMAGHVLTLLLQLAVLAILGLH